MEVLIGGERYVPEAVGELLQAPLSELLREARILRCESLEAAAAAIGTTKSHLWELENSRCEPRLSLLQKLLRYYGLSFEQIAESS